MKYWAWPTARTLVLETMHKTIVKNAEKVKWALCVITILRSEASKLLGSRALPFHCIVWNKQTHFVPRLKSPAEFNSILRYYNSLILDMEAPFVMGTVLEIKCFRRRARANPFGRTISKQLLVWHFTIWTRGTTLSGFSPVCLLELYSTAFLSLLWQLTGQTFCGRSINKPKAGGWSRKGG